MLSDVAGTEAVHCGFVYQENYEPGFGQWPEFLDALKVARGCVLQSYQAEIPFVVAWSFLAFEYVVTIGYVGVVTDRGFEVRRYGANSDSPTVGVRVCERFVETPDCVDNPDVPTLVVGSLCLECESSDGPEVECTR